MALVKTNLKFGIGGRSGYKKINNKTYRIRVSNNCITEMANNNTNKLIYKPAVSFYEKEAGIPHKELLQILPLFIKEKISQNVLHPISNANEATKTSHPAKIMDNGIRFEYNYDDSAIIQIKKTTEDLLARTVSKVVKDTINLNNIKKPKLVLIFPCCIFEAILAKSGIKEMEQLKKQSISDGSKIVGTYVYGEVGMFDKEIKSASGTVVCLVIGDELTK